jgi:hypothetical protein
MRVLIKSVSNMEVAGVEMFYLKIAISVGRHVLDVKDSVKISPTNPRWSNSEVR